MVIMSVTIVDDGLEKTEVKPDNPGKGRGLFAV
jgi:hypothetical protein